MMNWRDFWSRKERVLKKRTSDVFRGDSNDVTRSTVFVLTVIMKPTTQNTFGIILTNFLL